MDLQLLGLGMDVVIAVLLCTTIVYAFMLNKRLQALRADREEMEKLLRKFYDATAKAEASISGLKKSSQDLGGELQEKIDKARLLRDELSFMLERGDLLANQLDIAISSSRTDRPQPELSALLQKADNAKRPGKDGGAGRLEDIFQSDADTHSTAEKELIKALKGLR